MPMELQFCWTEGPAGRWATAEEVGETGVRPLACLLMDDGGIDRPSSLAWLREGIARVDAVLCGAAHGRMHWDREAWGAAVTVRETTIHSLLDETCTQVIPTPAFRRALVEWMHFLVAGVGMVVVELD